MTENSRQFISTRQDSSESIGFSKTILAGLADDGGLYVPKEVPVVDPATLAEMEKLPYAELAARVMRYYIAPSDINDAELKDLCDRSYKVGPDNFVHPDVVPVTDEKDGIYICELFNGPTFAFKDYALQFLGNLFEHVLKKEGGCLRILGATSGDTGSAAIYGVRGKERIECVILYPKGRTSKIQERQMATVPDKNIFCLSVKDSTFDDCQNIVKAIFSSPMKKELSLGAVNSINWARIMAQIVYYFFTAFQIRKKLGRPVLVDFSVPTGNFGDILAGYYAKKMGAPINRLIIASNSNDILTRFFETGAYSLTGVTQTMSPSMDIQISSNFERFLYDLFSRNPKTVRSKFADLAKSKSFKVTPDELARAKQSFAAERVDEEQTLKTICDVYKKTKYLLCPHSAIGYEAAKRQKDKSGKVPMVALATAHWGKFMTDIVEKDSTDPAVKEKLKKLLKNEELPKRLADTANKAMRSQEIGNNRSLVEDFFRRTFSERPSASRNTMPIVVGAIVVALGAMWYMRSRNSA